MPLFGRSQSPWRSERQPRAVAQVPEYDPQFDLASRSVPPPVDTLSLGARA